MTIKTKSEYKCRETGRTVEKGERLTVPRVRGLSLISSGAATLVSDDDLPDVAENTIHAENGHLKNENAKLLEEIKQLKEQLAAQSAEIEQHKKLFAQIAKIKLPK
jgi:septin family protein